MAEIFTLLIVFALYFPISIVKANDLPPDFYQVDYKSSDFPTQLKGFYRKEDYTHNEKTVYKKPRRDNYLYVDEDDKWTVGTKWTRDTNEDRIAMANEGYDLPESGEWEGLISGREDEHDLDVSVTEYKPEYPDYYQVTSSMEDLEGYYEKLPESQNLQKFPVFRKEIQGKQTYTLYFDLYGDWVINWEGQRGRGFANSLGKGLPKPDLSKGWKIYEGSWKADEEFRVTPINPFYPTEYTMEYHGSDKTLLAKLQTLNVLGHYTKQQADHIGVPVYQNSQTRMNLYHCINGQWVISYHVSTACDTTSTIYQESNGSPMPLESLTWKLTKTNQLLFGLYLTAQQNTRRLDYVDDDNANRSNIGMVFGIVLGVAIFLITVAITAFYVLKKFRKEEEVASIDVNTDYKHYQDYDEDNVVIDNNDYYETNNVDTEYYTYTS